MHLVSFYFKSVFVVFNIHFLHIFNAWDTECIKHNVTFFLVFLCKFFNVEKDRDTKDSPLILQDSLGVKCKKRLIKKVKIYKY